jgi:hypothetical protein
MSTDPLLLCHVHPTFYEDGYLLSPAFYPFSHDKNKLSLYDGEKITYEDNYLHHIL